MELRLIAFAQYCIFDLVACGAMVYFRKNILRYTERKLYVKYFIISIESSIILAASDLVFAVREYNIIQIPDMVSSLFEGIYTLSSIISAYCWVLCAETLKNSKHVSQKPYFYLFSAPLVIMIALTLTNPLHHLVYTIENGVYTRNVLTIVFTVTVVLIVFSSGVASYIQSFSKDQYSDKEGYRILFYYSVALLVSAVLQLAIGPKIPFRSICITCVFFFAQDKIMKSNIFIDKLSQINNRLSIEQYLLGEIQNKRENFYCAMLDIDDFKSINDRYGHTEGDKAIMIMGEALRKSAVPGIMIGRYGGDEFVFAGALESEAQMEPVIQNLRDNLCNAIKEHGLQFSFGFSIGYAKLEPDINSITGLIKLADTQMYKNKRDCQRQ